MKRQHLLQLAVVPVVVALSATLAGCSEDSTPSEKPAAESAGGSPGDAGATASLPGLPDPATGEKQLGELTIAPEGSMDGYSRDKFPHWLSEDGCTVRQQVLQRDGTGVETDDNCQPQKGEWFSPFDEVTLTAAGDVDIDHIVPLANAWRSGADSWDTDTRSAFANDLQNPQLLAVSASSNRSKGDQSPADWQPVEAYWCEYALAWTATKHTYELTITDEEHEALTEMLNTCPA